MKKKLVAMALCATMAMGMATGCGSNSKESTETPTAETTTEATTETKEETTQTAEATEDVKFDVEAEYEPNADYDKYTVFEYTIESAGATFAVTLSSTEDESKMEIHCNFYGDEQLVVAEKDGDTYKVVSDKTGFMETDTPMICQAGIDNNKWAPIK